MLSASATRFFCAFAAIAAWRKFTSMSRLQYGQPSWPKYSITRLPCLAASATSSRRSEEHTSELQSQSNLVCRLLLEKKNPHTNIPPPARPPRPCPRLTTAAPDPELVADALSEPRAQHVRP